MTPDANYMKARQQQIEATLNARRIPAGAVEVTQRGIPNHYACQTNGHDWVPDESSGDSDYWCQSCGAYGNLVRPMGARR